MKQTLVTQYDIQAYIDDRLDDHRRRIVEDYLSSRPDLKAEVERDIENAKGMKRAFDSLDTGPVPQSILSPADSGGNWRLIAASLGMIAVAGLTGYSVGKSKYVNNNSQPSYDWVDMATSAHKTFAVEIAHPVEVTSDKADHLATWLGKRLSQNVTIPDFKPQGYRLMGGRLLSSEVGPTGQLMYQDKSGQRITLYMRPYDGDEISFRFADDDGVSAFYWIENGLAFALVGGDSRDTLERLATIAYHNFR